MKRLIQASSFFKMIFVKRKSSPNPILKMNKFKLLPAILALLSLASCNVHEWPHPVEEYYPFTLYLEFEDDITLYKEVYFSRGTEEDSRADEDNYDIRYLINIYKVRDENDGNRDVYKSFTFSQPYTANHNYQVSISLPEGNYRFRVWSDHVRSGSQNDCFYSTSDWTSINIDENEGHPGNNEMRDAFKGTTYATVFDPEIYFIRNGKNPDNKSTVEMLRPMGRYEFVSTDMDDFLENALTKVDEETINRIYQARSADLPSSESYWNGLTRDEVADVMGLDKYTIEFSYNAFMPSSYNLYTDKPSDSSTGIKYQSKMQIGNDGMKMGFDYVITNDQTTMNLNMNIYNEKGQLVSSTSGVEVPVVRSKNTVVKGTFLTVSSGGGVTINPDFEGDDFNIEIH